MLLFPWLRRPDSNRRPLGYEPNELPTAPLRDVYFLIRVQRYGLFLKQTSVLKEKYIFLQFRLSTASQQATRKFLPIAPDCSMGRIGQLIRME